MNKKTWFEVYDFYDRLKECRDDSNPAETHCSETQLNVTKDMKKFLLANLSKQIKKTYGKKFLREIL